VESAPLKDRVVHSGGSWKGWWAPPAVALLGSWLVALLASGVAKGKVGGQGLAYTKLYTVAPWAYRLTYMYRKCWTSPT
jgi:hypothetical protein